MFKAVALNHKKLIEIKEDGVVLDSFTIELKRLTDEQRANAWADVVSEIKTLNKGIDTLEDAEAIRGLLSGSFAVSADRLKQHVTGWVGLTDADNKSIAFNSENLASLLEWREYRLPIDKVFIEFLTGSSTEESAKN